MVVETQTFTTFGGGEGGWTGSFWGTSHVLFLIWAGFTCVLTEKAPGVVHVCACMMYTIFVCVLLHFKSYLKQNEA